ncbi:hypothetical protein, partial [Phenylobacterium aquaticum]|uniref:hypothetical protein n=1 Tax=Phenylobacterium aquaticum TaxID=1763816 RepID=UPI001F5DE643
AALPARAEPDLGPALIKVRAEDWRGALGLLNPITAAGCPAMALYLSGLSSAKLGDAKATLKAEARALGCAPPLAPAYADGARKLTTWAAETLAARPSFTFGGTMSVAGLGALGGDSFASHAGDAGEGAPATGHAPTPEDAAVAAWMRAHAADDSAVRTLVRDSAREAPGLDQVYARARRNNARQVAQCVDPRTPQSVRLSCSDWLANGVEPPETPVVALPDAAPSTPPSP